MRSFINMCWLSVLLFNIVTTNIFKKCFIFESVKSLKVFWTFKKLLCNFSSFLLLSLTSVQILDKFNMKKLMKDASVSKEPQFNLEYYTENPAKFVQKDTELQTRIRPTGGGTSWKFWQPEVVTTLWNVFAMFRCHIDVSWHCHNVAWLRQNSSTS